MVARGLISVASAITMVVSRSLLTKWVEHLTQCRCCFFNVASELATAASHLCFIYFGPFGAVWLNPSV